MERWHANDRKQFFYLAKGSARECVPILEICRRKNLIRIEDYEAMKNEIDVVIKMIYGLVKGLDKRKSEEENER